MVRRTTIMVFGLAVLLCSCLVSAEAAAPLSSAAPILAQLAAQAKDRSLDPEERLGAVQALAAWGGDAVRAPLVELLKDPTPEIRVAAAKGLGSPGDVAAIPALRERAADQTEQSAVRAASTEALVRIGDGSLRPFLLQASRDADPQVREAAFGGLVTGPFANPSDRFALAVRAVEDADVSPQYRAEVIRMLSSSGDKAAGPVLLNILENGTRMKIAVPPTGSDQQQTLSVRFQQIRDVRAWAARGLGELDYRPALPNLLKAAEDTDDFFLRYLAGAALLRWRAPEALPAFLRLLGDPSKEVRVVAATGVGLVGNQSNVDAVSALLKDQAEEVRAGAAGALGTLGGATARQRLQAAYQNEPNPEVRRAMDAALARLAR